MLKKIFINETLDLIYSYDVKIAGTGQFIDALSFLFWNFVPHHTDHGMDIRYI